MSTGQKEWGAKQFYNHQFVEVRKEGVRGPPNQKLVVGSCIFCLVPQISFLKRDPQAGEGKNARSKPVFGNVVGEEPKASFQAVSKITSKGHRTKQELERGKDRSAVGGVREQCWHRRPRGTRP